ncbi:MAG: PAS domain S-box protein [Candidatus Delongbacteria bacterium]|nr:PAS domain S-box protein [Candidatus Delongbacteria bacterium]
MKNNKLPVIAVGASAGGLEAIEQFLSNIPNDIEAAIVIIQHLDPNHESNMPGLISKYSGIKTKKIKSGLTLKKRTIYTIPNDKDVTIMGGHFVLQNRPTKAVLHFPVDKFFISLKEEYGRNAIGVILSGAGSDGAKGIAEINKGGGLTLAQDPSTAAYNGMPSSAIATRMIDYVLPPEEMAEKIITHIQCTLNEGSLISPEDPKTLLLIRDILNLVRQQTRHDFSEYKKSTICRRIERRMVALQLSDLDKYLEKLKTDKDEVVVLFDELLINVTNFFRDPSVFEYIDNHILEKIISSCEDNRIRVWVPACSTGEEAYTWAILIKRYIENNHLSVELTVFATDIDLKALEVARAGKYSLNISEDIPEDILEHYFIKNDNTYEVKKYIREMIIFAEQNVLQDPPYSKLDVVSCRNFLIYLEDTFQQKAISVFHYSLKMNGYLLLGDSESLGGSAKYFKIDDKKYKTFKKIESNLAGIRIWDMTKYHTTKKSLSGEFNREMPLKDIAQKAILDNYCPAGIIINHNAEILYVQGRTGKFLELSTGRATNNIINTAREGLRIPLTNAILKSKTTMKEVKHNRIRVKTNGDFELIDLSVMPLKSEIIDSDLILVVFKESQITAIGSESDNNDPSEVKNIKHLQKELDEAKEYLQSTIEELESTNEELKSSNEEAQSTNEELQSTNEELETSKEELQSVNEELLTTNYELQNKVKELTDVNNDIINLLSSTNIATIFLDRQLRIFKFTPCANQIIGLLDSDIGRLITHFAHNLTYNDLESDLKEVLRTLIPKEIEVTTLNGNYYWMRILPYRTIDDKIEGVVITFTDITVIKQQEVELNNYRNHLEEIVKQKTIEVIEKEDKFRAYIQNSPIAIFVANKIGIYTYVNEAGIKLLGYSLDEITTKSFKDVSKNRNLNIFNKIKKDGRVNSIETEWRKNDGSLVPVLFDAVKVSNDEIIVFCKNIANIKEAESKLISEKEKVQHCLDIAGFMFLALDKEGNITLVNKKFCEITGYSENKALGKNWFDNFIPKDDLKEVNSVFKKIISGKDKNLEFYKNTIVTKSGEEKIISWHNSLLKDENGKIIGVLCSGEDITEKEKVEQKLERSNAELEQFSYAVSHDLKEPLRMISSFAKLLEQNYGNMLDDTAKTYLNFISDGSVKMHKKIQNVLEYSRLSKFEEKPVKTDLNNMLLEALDNLKILIGESKAAITNKGLPKITTHPHQMVELLQNLISNAIKYKSEDKLCKITIDSKYDDKSKEWIISVKDNGIGIEKKHFNDIFVIFNKLNKDKKYESNGIGLALCKRIVELNKGNIWVESKGIGKGSTFKFTLPRIN